jgi:hypothetical protein
MERITKPKEGGKEGGVVPTVVDEKSLSSHRMILEVLKGIIGKLILVQSVNAVELC